MLPRIASQPLKSENIFTNPSANTRIEKLGDAAADFAKSYGEHPGAQSPPMKLIEFGASHVLSSETRSQLQPEHVKGVLETLCSNVVRSPVGWPFRQTFRRRADLVVNGTPYSHAGTIMDAVDAITTLTVCSLKEDIMGTVQGDVPTIIRTIKAAIEAIKAFLGTLDSHWTDADFKEKDRDVTEVKLVLDALKKGLEQLLLAFGEYLEGSMKMGKREVREAKELVVRIPAQAEEEKLVAQKDVDKAKVPEMRERKRS